MEYCLYFCRIKARKKLFMVRKIKAAVLLLVTLFALNSCVSSSSSEENAASGDCAITAVTMGTLTRTVYTTTTAGNDTSYAVSVAGSAYPMYVDQLKLEIYNPDSLPQNTNVKKMLLSSITADGVVLYRTTYGNDTLFSANDSIDFTQPRLFTCYSTDGTQSKSYRISVNVHKSNSEEFSWNTVAEGVSEFAGLTSQKAFKKGQNLFVFAVKEGQAQMMQADVATPTDWTVTTLGGFSEFSPYEVQLLNDCFYVVDKGVVKKSADGINWTTESTEVALQRLIGTDRNTLYGLSDSGIYSTTDGISWTREDDDGDLADFPVNELTSVWSEMNFNENFSYILACGKSGDESCVWKKVIDANGYETEPWAPFPQGDSEGKTYPALPQSVMLAYDSKIVYAGIEDGQISNFFVSNDGGRSWIEQLTSYKLPKKMEAESFSMTVDEDGFIWIICSPSGTIIKGRLNRLSYAKNQQVFS